MTKAIFTARITPQYDDVPEFYYHFPQQYLSRVQETVGDLIVYYEPRRTGGRMCYFASARVVRVREDPRRSGFYYADVSDFLSFPQVVPLKGPGGTYEIKMSKDDGSISQGIARSAVRLIKDEEFSAILGAAFADSGDWGSERSGLVIPGLAEDQSVYERPITTSVLRRPFRDAAFMAAVRAAYSSTCLLTGLRLINGGGRPEIDAAHIQPVGDGHNGPDSVRNGVALSKTAHWMFDRGLVSLSDDFELLVAKNDLPPDATRLFQPGLRNRLPQDARLQPHKSFLQYHREEICKSRGHKLELL